MTDRIGSYREFWPFYLAEHSRPGTRALHLLGTGAALPVLIAGIVAGDWRLVLGAIAVGYGFAWLGHAAIESNRPATFRYPLWSLISDIRMLGLFLAGRLQAEIARHGAGRTRHARGAGAAPGKPK